MPISAVCVHFVAVDTEASGDGAEQNRKRKHDISPIKWTSADTEAEAEAEADTGNDYTVVVVYATADDAYMFYRFFLCFCFLAIFFCFFSVRHKI